MINNYPTLKEAKRHLEFGDVLKLKIWEQHVQSLKRQIKHAQNTGDMELLEKLQTKLNSYKSNK